MMVPGGGFLIFGIPVSFVEYDPLKLLGQSADFVVVPGVLESLQTKM
jgi:hypothetical protein